MTALTDEEKIEFAKECLKTFVRLHRIIIKYKDFLDLNDNEKADLLYCLNLSIVVTYIRPFSSNNYLSVRGVKLWPLNDLFKIVAEKNWNPLLIPFSEKELALHETLMVLRNKYFAHRDDDFGLNEPVGIANDQIELFLDWHLTKEKAEDIEILVGKIIDLLTCLK